MPSQIRPWEFQLDQVNGKIIPETKGCILEIWLYSPDVKRQQEDLYEHAQKYTWRALRTDLPLACSGHSDYTITGNYYFCNGSFLHRILS